MALKSINSVKKKTPAGEPQPRGRPCKITVTEALTTLTKTTNLVEIDNLAHADIHQRLNQNRNVNYWV